MRIIVLREAGGLGDVVATEPAVRGLRAKYPGAEIWYACLPEYRGLVSLWPQKPDVYLSVERRERRIRDAKPDAERWPYLKAAEGFDQVIDLFCPAFRYECRRKAGTDKSRVRLFCEAAGVEPSAPELELDEKHEAWAEGWLAGQGIDPRKALIGLQPLSCGPRRNWPLANWAKLAEKLQARGCETISFHSFAAPIKGIGRCQASGLPLPRMAALVNACRLMITPDSGFLHLASALSRPVLSLWGSTNPYVSCEYYPQARHIWPRERGRPEGCAPPCYSMPGCRSRMCVRGCAVLESILVEEVEARVFEMCGRGRRREV